MVKKSANHSPTATITEIGERELILRLTKILGHWGNQLISGSDDAVAYPAPKDSMHILVFKTDMLVDTTDVPPQMSYYQMGRKTFVMNCSDLFVKGVKPKWAVIALGLPRSLPITGNRSFDALIEGLRDGAKEFGVDYLGGDLNETKELIVSITIGGECHPKKLIKRQNAQIGDLIYTTGEYGLTGIGFQVLLDPNSDVHHYEFDPEPSIKTVLNPNTDTQIGLRLAELGWAHASADSSDGLLKTLEEISLASNVGIELYWKQIPIANSIKKLQEISGKQWEQAILGAGEEFTHIFVIDRTFEAQVSQEFYNKLTCIGKVVSAEHGLKLIDFEGKNLEFSQFNKGYDHF